MQSQLTPNALYISRAQAAEKMAISIQTISKLIRTGRLPAFYVGRSVRIKVSDLESTIERYNPAAPRGSRKSIGPTNRRRS
jgi:excisionase family DNA binding protein